MDLPKVQVTGHTNSNEHTGGQPGHSDHPITVGSEADCERYREFGNVCLKDGRPQHAETCYGWALGSAANLKQYTTAYCNRAAARLMLGKYEAAAADAERAAQLDPDNPKAHFRQAEAYAHLERYEDALKCYGHASALCPEDAKISAGIMNCRAKQREEEEHAQRKVLEEQAQKNAAIVETDDDDDDDDDVIDLAPRDPRISTTRTAGVDEAATIRQEIGAAVGARLGLEPESPPPAQPIDAELAARRAKFLALGKELNLDAEALEALLEKNGVGGSAARPGSPEVLDVEEGRELDTEYTHSPQRCQEPHAATAAAGKDLYYDPLGADAPQGGKKKQKNNKASTDYSRFEALADDLSDDETGGERVRRHAVEVADEAVVQQCTQIFSFFDKDADGHWNMEEAGVATKVLEGNELTREAYNEKCEMQGLSQSAGWTVQTVVMMYTATPAALALLPKHVKHINTLEFQQRPARIRAYHPNDQVEGFLDGEWKRGTVCQKSDGRDAAAYDVMWTDGTGTRGVPAARLRPHEVAYTGPTGLRGEGKKIAATVAVDARSGVARDKQSTTRTEKVAKPAYVAAGSVGCELLEDDDVPARSDLPEDPVERLKITAQQTGFADEETGLLSREKLAKVIGLRPNY